MNKTPAYYLQKYAELNEQNIILASNLIGSIIQSIAITLILILSSKNSEIFIWENSIFIVLNMVAIFIIFNTIWYKIKLHYYAYKHAKVLLKYLKENTTINYTYGHNI